MTHSKEKKRKISTETKKVLQGLLERVEKMTRYTVQDVSYKAYEQCKSDITKLIKELLEGEKNENISD